jgi:hypothetical protein
MRLKVCWIAVAVLALAVPAAAAAHLGERLTMKVQTKEHQQPRELAAKVTCVNDPCRVTITGKARAAGKTFAIKPKTGSLLAGEEEKFQLRVKKLRDLEELLVDAEGKATLDVRATSDAGSVAKLKAKITLTD